MALAPIFYIYIMRTFLIAFAFLITISGFSQSDALAKNYFDQGEFEKSLQVYEMLSKQYPHRLDYFMGMIKSAQQLEKFSEVERLLTDKLGDGRSFPQLYVELGRNYALQNKAALATENYQKAIDAIENNPSFGYNIGNVFEQYNLLDEAIAAYKKAMELNDRLDFSVQLAQLYGEQGKLEMMFESYLDIVERNKGFQSVAQRYFSQYVNEDPSNEGNIILRKTLLKRSQENPETLYNELLSWLFVQQKEYKKAFVQEKAIYKREAEDLNRIFEVANIAIDDKDYVVGKEIITFVIENSHTLQNRLQANQILMKMEVETADPKKYAEVERKFESLLNEFGLNAETYQLQIDYNHFLAFKKNEKEKAISNLKTLEKQPLSSYQEARVKMELADILVVDEKFNAALIYYTQIQRKLQNDLLAQEARFKVARTSYFKGDFEWAQVQLDVLKKSTSQLIANDAMELSLLIKDNSLEDSTQTALKKYARADLLAFQERDLEAIAALDDILLNNKGETIEDEAWLKQGEIYEKLGENQKAVSNYEKILEYYNDGILADDAHYRLAQLFEDKLDKPEQAKHHYEQIIFNHADSIFFVEARKKFRILRGDTIN